MTEPKKHPAPFSIPVLHAIEEILEHELEASGKKKLKVLDPFAGIGLIHMLNGMGIETFGIELEPEWALQHPRTEVGDATKLRFRKGSFDVVATSPSYANRMGDNYNAQDGSDRRNYRFMLGRPLSENSSAGMTWGSKIGQTEYKVLHDLAWTEANRVLVPGGLAVINVSNHFITLVKGEPPVEQKVVEWHLDFFLNHLDYTFVEARRIKTRRYKKGSNRDTRADGELVFVVRKPQ